MLEHGLLGLSGWQTLAYALLVTHITIVGVTVYLHRFSAHRALDMHPALQHFFRFWIWSTTAMLTKDWTSIHRKHHAKCETEEDPHSPVKKGLWTVLSRGAELYDLAKDPETLERYGKGTPDDWLERKVYSRFPIGGVLFTLVLNMLLLGPIGITVWAVQMMWMPIFAAGIINGLGHNTGYRNFDSPDASTNIVPWGFVIGGEELHNNHHTYPNSAKLSVKPWEFDLGWFYIRIFSKLGLIWNIRRGPVVHHNPTKESLDSDAALAAANNRFQVMASFNRKVLQAAAHAQLENADKQRRALLKRVSKLIGRDMNTLKPKQQGQVTALINQDAMLKTLVEFRQQLQQVWHKRTATREELFAELSDWCKRAEESGIEVLRQFAQQMRSYSTVAA